MTAESPHASAIRARAGAAGPKRRRARLAAPFLAALVAAAACRPAAADVVVLADGKMIEGEVSDRGESYDVKTKYGPLSIRKSDVKQVVKGSGAAAAEAPPGPLAPAVTPQLEPASIHPPPKPPESASVTPPAPSKPPPPDAAQKQAEALIRSLFKAEYAKRSASDLSALARKLLEQGAETKDDPAARFVLYREARDLAAQAGDIETALRAAENTIQAYDVDPLAERLAALGKAEAAVRSAETARLLVDCYVRLADEAAAADQFESALRIVARAQAAAARDAALGARVRDRLREIQEIQKESAALAVHHKTLATNPDDGPANTAVGKFTSFVKRDWKRGLPMLAKGSDPILKALAEKELAKPSSVADRVALADGWWDAGDKMTGSAKLAALERASHWYESAAEQATGLTQAKIRVRLEAYEKLKAASAGPGSPAPFPPPGLVFWVEPGRDPGDGLAERIARVRPVNHGATVATEGGVRALVFNRTYLEYPVSEAVQQIGPRGSIVAWIKTDAPEQKGGVGDRGIPAADDFGLWVDGGRLMTWINWPQNTKVLHSRGAVPARRWVLGGLTWNDRDVAFYIDGRPAGVEAHGGVPMKRGTKIYIGCNIPGGHEFYSGMVGSLMIFNRELSPREIAQLHEATRGRFR
jgi:hypothetical protein